MYIVYGFFFLVVAIAHLAAKPTGCDDTTWGKGCVNKIPFCKSLFTPTCNCVSLKIESDYSLTALPNTLVDEMTGLRKVFIRNCNLTTLPPKMEQLTEMVDFEVSFNRLEEFDVDVLKWELLSELELMFNNITKYNMNLWQHPQLVNLGINSNKGLWMPQDATKIKLPQLIYLHMGNNSGIISNELSSAQLPAISDMYLDGNKMENFPSKFHTFQTTLQYLGVARCGLKELEYLELFDNLKYLDARNNSITSVSPEIKAMIKGTTDFESYFSGNPACQNDKDLNCKQVCTDYCWSEKGFTNGGCDVTCDSRECKYDGGECKV